MSKHLERAIENLEREILALSALVEDTVERACRALHERNHTLIDEVRERESRIDQLEVHIEEECLKILALHQPVATDLRRVAAVMKINNDLERIGDLAVNIVDRTEGISLYTDVPIPALLDRMAAAAIEMVHRALDAFVNLDSSLARAVTLQDAEIDQLNRQVIEELREFMTQRPDLAEPALQLFSASRHIEQIADHASNIAEDVLYLIQGEIARHRHDEPITTRPPH